MAFLSRIATLTFGVAISALPGCVEYGRPSLPVVPRVDLARYAGKWYEIASYPAPFQRGCTGTTAEYTLLENGRVKVVNRCFDGSLSGPERRIEGTARVVDRETGAKLAVTFFWPFEGPYWILMLDEDYQYAVVGEPARAYLWILSRTPTMDEATYESILAELPAFDYDPSRLNRTPQPAE